VIEAENELGLCLMQAGEIETAVECFRRAIDSMHECPEFPLVDSLRGVLYENLGLALKEFDQVSIALEWILKAVYVFRALRECCDSACSAQFLRFSRDLFSCLSEASRLSQKLQDLVKAEELASESIGILEEIPENQRTWKDKGKILLAECNLASILVDSRREEEALELVNRIFTKVSDLGEECTQLPIEQVFEQCNSIRLNCTRQEESSR